MQVSVYDTINKDAQYSLKVRRLGEYHPGLAATKDQEGQDIGDPLYGNEGGVDELVSIFFLYALFCQHSISIVRGFDILD